MTTPQARAKSLCDETAQDSIRTSRISNNMSQAEILKDLARYKEKIKEFAHRVEQQQNEINDLKFKLGLLNNVVDQT